MQLQAPNSDHHPDCDSPSTQHENEIEQVAEQFGCSPEREEHIEEYLLGRLDPIEASDLLSHLSTCKSCRLHFEEMKELLG